MIFVLPPVRQNPIFKIFVWSQKCRFVLCASGIVIPDNAGEKPDQGEVIAVGPGKRDEAGKLLPMDVKVGDRVLFGKYSGQNVKVDGEEFLVMREEDIMGVLA